jgi:archaeal cell division control protein 6
MAKTVEDELAGPTVFKDRKVVDFDWVPPRLWHRDEELSRISQLFRGVAEGSTSQRALIMGEVGTGKTALAKFFCQKFQEAMRPKGVVVEYQWVNCRQNASEGLVLLQLLKKFDPNYPDRGYSTNEMLNDLRKHIDRRGIHFIALLDEVDALVRKETDLVYALTRFDDQRTVRKPTLSLLMVSARADVYDMLDEATRSTVKETNLVRLKRYSPKQLRDIVADRVTLGFHKGAVDDDVVDLIIDIAGPQGDARYAIELLEKAGYAADGDHSDRVQPDHVRSAKAHTRSFVSEAKLRNLQRQPLCVLLAVARKLKRSKRTYLTTGEAEEAYKLVAEEFGEPARAHTQFWKYLKELETADWLHLKRTEATSAGQTQQISLQDLPAPILVEKIEGLLAGRGTDS